MKTIFFDFDGTLVDVDHRFYRVFRDFILENEKVEIKKPNYIKQKKHGINDFEIASNLGVKLNYSQYINFKREKLEEINYLSSDKCIMGLRERLSYLNEKQYNLNIISLRRKPTNLRNQLDSLYLSKYFNEIYVLDPDKSKNPKKHFFSSYDGKIDYFIGDSLSDFEAVQHSEIKFLNVETGLVDISKIYKLENLITFSTVIKALEFILFS